jgi:xylose isomerase
LKAARLIKDGRIDNFVRDRYASYSEGIGKKIVDGEVDLEALAQYAGDLGKPSMPGSGKQEYLQSIVNSVMFTPDTEDLS